jgi:uncharacterized protein (DUF433 family)
MAIVCDDELGGDARIDGTRIGANHVVQFHDAGYSIQEIADEFDLELEEVEEAIEYAQKHDVRRD